MIILYNGPSKFNGEPIVMLLTGDDRASANRKTGDALQTWILHRDIPPTEAVRSKADEAICGTCPLRGTSCYVVVAQAPTTVWKAFKRGAAKQVSTVDLVGLLQYRPLRLGSYGDPAAVPYSINERLITWSRSHVGYTSAWRDFPEYKGLLMASVHTELDAIQARSAGWNTYRIKPEGEQDMQGENECPSNRGITCTQCLACNGSRGNRTIEIHGTEVKKRKFIELVAAT